MRRAALTLALIGSVGLAAWCWRVVHRPSLLLISVDSLRPDHLSCYGSDRVATPHIDALANAGVLFTQAVTDIPWTRGAMTSVMTGRYASGHRVRSIYQRLAEEPPTLAEAFGRAGYRTAAVVDSFELDHIFRLSRGFDVYDDRCDEPVVGSEPHRVHLASIFYGDFARDNELRRHKLVNDGMRGDDRTTDAAVAWLRRAGIRPFFLWVHYFGAREQWAGDATIDDVIAEYPERVQHADVAVGRLLQALTDVGRASNTIVVLHADYGRRLDWAGFPRGVDLSDATLRVPLIVYWPRGLGPPRRIDGLVRLVDLFPTVTELAGLRPPPDGDGRSLAPLLRGADSHSATEAYAETYVPTTLPTGRAEVGGQELQFGFVRRAIRTERWKYIRDEPSPSIDAPSAPPLPAEVRRSSTREELYDLGRDPEETTNLVAQEPTTAATLRARLDSYLGRCSP